MGYQDILYTKDEGIATITINRPEKMNALRKITLEEMADAIGDARSDDTIRVVVLTGAGRGFCAGGDVAEDTFPPQEKDIASDAGLRGSQRRLYSSLRELDKPGRDPRKTFEAFSFTDGIEKIADLRQGMQLPGIVTNITAFGAFIDIGVHQDGLVHISQMADRFVKNPADIVKVQQKVLVTVLDVDMDRNRIALSMKKGVDPEKKKTPTKTRSKKREDSPREPKPDKKQLPKKKPVFQGSLAEALLKSGLK